MRWWNWLFHGGWNPPKKPKSAEKADYGFREGAPDRSVDPDPHLKSNPLKRFPKNPTKRSKPPHIRRPKQ